MLINKIKYLINEYRKKCRITNDDVISLQVVTVILKLFLFWVGNNVYFVYSTLLLMLIIDA